MFYYYFVCFGNWKHSVLAKLNFGLVKKFEVMKYMTVFVGDINPGVWYSYKETSGGVEKRCRPCYAVLVIILNNIINVDTFNSHQV